MEEQQGLLEKREEVRREILALKDKMSTGVVLNLAGRLFPNSISENSPAYWILQIVFLNAVILVPGLSLVLAFGEITRLPDNIAAWYTAVELAIFGHLMAHVLYRSVLGTISGHIINKITNPENLSTLAEYCRSSSTSTYAYLVAGGVIWSIAALILLGFNGYGLTYMTIPTGFLMGGGFQIVFWAIGLTSLLTDFQYELNTFTPVNSEAVARLSGMLNRIIYLTGGFFVVLTLLTSSPLFGNEVNEKFAIPLTVIGWIIIIIQFIVHRSTINGIVEKERWTSLNKLQLQMNTIQTTEDLSNKDVSERLLRLADLHERIRSDRSAGFDFKSLLSLFSQLMLPLLGLLLGNIDKIIEFPK